MRLLNATTESGVSFPKLSLSIATTREEVREVQRLRYKVFIEAMGLACLANDDGIDADQYDAHCDHLIVRDTNTLKVVGTYRLLSPSAARDIGRFYSEGEFDLTRHGNIRSRQFEAGRACHQPAYPSGGVIMLLWAGIAAYMHRERCDYLIGCASISLADGGHNAVAVCQTLSETHLAPPEYRVTPHVPFPIHDLKAEQPSQIPPLLKGYMRSGAWICGDPAWDADFNSADLFLLLPLDRMDGRYARRYLKDGSGT